MLEQPGVAGPGELVPLLLQREAREHGTLGRAVLVDGDDDAVARAGQRTGARHRLAEHGVEVEGGVDAQDGRVEGGGGLARRLAPPPRVVGLRHGSSFSDSAGIAARPCPGIAVCRADRGVPWRKTSSKLIETT